MEARDEKELVGISWLLKWPLLVVLFPFVGGILMAERVSVSLPILFGLALMTVVLAAIFRKLLPWLLPIILLLAGWTSHAVRTAVISPVDLRVVLGDQPELVSIRGVLTETPIDRIHERDEKKFYRVMAKVRVTEIGRTNTWQPAFGVVAVTTPGSLSEEYYDGQTVEFTGVMATPPNAVAPGLFDYRDYLRHLGIFFHVRTDGAKDWKVLKTSESPEGPPLSVRFSRWAHQVLALGLPQDEAVDLIRGMALGWRTALNNEVSKPFMQSGTMHLFAISGLHIALIAVILVELLRFARLPRFYAGLLSIPLLWFYTVATGWQSSAIRSAIMMTVIIAGWMLHRPSNLLNSLGAAAFVILVWDPLQLFQAGFQLSFLVVLSIALLVPPFTDWRDRLLETDPFLPKQLVPRWQQLAIAAARWGTTGVVTSFAAWLGSLPLIAHYFHLFTPISLLANVLVVPASSVALAANLGSFIFGTWAPGVTELFNHTAWLCMRWMMIGSEWSATIPAGWIYVPSFLTSMYFSYYVLLLLIISRNAVKPRWRIVTIAACVALVTPMLWQWQRNQSTVRITVLAIGGDAIHVDMPSRKNDFLIDCGNDSAAETTVIPYLHAQGIGSLPRILLTHGDIRHTGGAEMVHEEFGVTNVVISPIRSRSPSYRKFLQEVEDGSDQVQQVHRNSSIDRWQVLHPRAEDKFSQGDDNAVVLRGEFENTKVLLLSDLGRPGQRALLEREKDLRADVVIVGIPSQGEPLMEELLDAIKPKAIIVSAAEFPAQERATPALRQRLHQRKVPVYYTSDTGSITVLIRPDGWRVETMREPKAFVPVETEPAKSEVETARSTE